MLDPDITDIGPRLEDALAVFPDSAEAVKLISFALKTAAEGAPTVDDVVDTRHERIREAVVATTPATRTRAAVVCSALSRVADDLRQLVLEVKGEVSDPDVIGGEAQVLPGGWLVVSLNQTEIGRVPFNPNRPEQEAADLARNMLTEYTRLHTLGEAEVEQAIGDTVRGPGTPDGVLTITAHKPSIPPQVAQRTTIH